eukprot:1189149-Prorocentrum_minimum.AAC.1
MALEEIQCLMGRQDRGELRAMVRDTQPVAEAEQEGLGAQDFRRRLLRRNGRDGPQVVGREVPASPTTRVAYE